MAKTKHTASRPEATRHRRSVKTIEVAGSLPVDLDTAGVALESAIGILDLLAVACHDVAIPNAAGNTLVVSLYTALREVRRADAALFGEVQS